MRVLSVLNVAVKVEFLCTIYNVEEDNPTLATSQTSKTISWTKCGSVYSEIQPESDTAKQ